MAGEPRRVDLISSEPLNSSKKNKKIKHSVRININLSKDSSNYEFSYKELYNKSKRERNGVESGGFDADSNDPFSNNDAAEHDRMVALARSYEVKYGKNDKSGRKKRKYDRVKDLVDMGDGYDESDAFIDNSEAYDEIVPACMTTKHGGFYINSGQLDFKVISGGESEDNEDIIFVRKRKKKKKFLDGSLIDKKRKGFGPSTEYDRLKKKRKLNNAKLLKRQSLAKKVASGSLKKSSLALAGTEIVEVALAGTEPINPKSTSNNSLPQKQHVSGSTTTTANSAPIITPGGTLIVNDMSGESSMDSIGGQADSTIEVSASTSLLKPASSSDEVRSHSPHPETAPKLPDSLSHELKGAIEQLKQAAVHAEGKSKFFTTPVNQLLLMVDTGIQTLPVSSRKCVFSHLAAYLPVGKQTLIVRAKKLRQIEQDKPKMIAQQKMRPTLDLLKSAIDSAMPSEYIRHQKELDAAVASHEKQTETKEEPKEEGGSTESDEEDKKDGEPKKRFKAPNRKFHFTDQIRSLLCQLVSDKLSLFDQLKGETKSAEEYLKHYFETELKLLWPKGWMHSRTLYKESKHAHANYTGMPLSAPKVKKWTVTSNASKSSNTVPVTTSTQAKKSLELSPSDVPVTTMSASSSLLDFAHKSFNSASKSKIDSFQLSAESKPVLSMGTVLKSEPSHQPIATTTHSVISNISKSEAKPSIGQLKPSTESFGFDTLLSGGGVEISSALTLMNNGIVQEKSISSSSNKHNVTNSLQAKVAKVSSQHDQVSSTSKRSQVTSNSLLSDMPPSKSKTVLKSPPLSVSNEVNNFSNLFNSYSPAECLKEQPISLLTNNHKKSVPKQPSQHPQQSHSQAPISGTSLLLNLTSNPSTSFPEYSGTVAATSTSHKPLKAHQSQQYKAKSNQQKSDGSLITSSLKSSKTYIVSPSAVSSSILQNQFSVPHSPSPTGSFNSKQSPVSSQFDKRKTSPQKLSSSPHQHYTQSHGIHTDDSHNKHKQQNSNTTANKQQLSGQLSIRQQQSGQAPIRQPQSGQTPIIQQQSVQPPNRQQQSGQVPIRHQQSVQPHNRQQQSVLSSNRQQQSVQPQNRQQQSVQPSNRQQQSVQLSSRQQQSKKQHTHSNVSSRQHGVHTHKTDIQSNIITDTSARQISKVSTSPNSSALPLYHPNSSLSSPSEPSAQARLQAYRDLTLISPERQHIHQMNQSQNANSSNMDMFIKPKSLTMPTSTLNQGSGRSRISDPHKSMLAPVSSHTNARDERSLDHLSSSLSTSPISSPVGSSSMIYPPSRHSPLTGGASRSIHQSPERLVGGYNSNQMYSSTGLNLSQPNLFSHQNGSPIRGLPTAIPPFSSTFPESTNRQQHPYH